MKFVLKYKIENIDLCNNNINNEVLTFLEKLIKKKRI